MLSSFNEKQDKKHSLNIIRNHDSGLESGCSEVIMFRADESTLNNEELRTLGSPIHRSTCFQLKMDEKSPKGNWKNTDSKI